MSSNSSIGKAIGACVVIVIAARVLPLWGENKNNPNLNLEGLKRITSDTHLNLGKINLGANTNMGLLGQTKLTSGSAAANLILNALPISFSEDFLASLTRARQEKKPLVLFIYRKDGQHSNAMAKTFADISMNQFATRAVYVKSEEQSRVSATYMKDLGIVECPAVVVFDPSNDILVEVGHTINDYSPTEFAPMFRDLLAKADKEIKSSQFIVQAIDLYRAKPNGENDAEIYKLLQQAADLGNVQAFNELGAKHVQGFGCKQDYAKAMEYFRKADAEKSAMATYNIGLLYEKGWGVPANLATAITYYRKAAENGDTKAQTVMGNIYRNGTSVAKDPTAAIVWYTRAAERGSIEGAREAGIMFRDGEGVVRNYTEALKWFRLGANGSDSDSVANLGWLYENGYGVDRDPAKAKDYFQQAANLGNTWAKDKLAGK